jgi:Sensors of blue-light using FAD
MALISLYYVSKSHLSQDEALLKKEIETIIEASIRRNAPEYITGVLLFDGRDFMQILEGEEAAVMTTFERISRDPRHSDVTVIETAVIAERECGSWWMRYVHCDDLMAPVLAPFTHDGRFEPEGMSKADVMSLLNQM